MFVHIFMPTYFLFNVIHNHDYNHQDIVFDIMVTLVIIKIFMFMMQ